MFDKRKVVVYISGAYLGSDNGANIAANIALARSMAISVWEAGFTALCPHLNTMHFEKDSNLKYQDYIDGDLVLIERCNAVLMLPNWRASKGAEIERQFAIDRGLSIFNSTKELVEFFKDAEIVEATNNRLDKERKDFRL